MPKMKEPVKDAVDTMPEMKHLINLIPGGIASYRVQNGCFKPTYFSDGVMALSGHSREEYEEMIGDDAFNIIYEPDRDRVFEAARAALEGDKILDVAYRIYHKDGRLIWIHLNGRRIGPLSEPIKFYCVFTGMSEESQLFQNIANETTDGIYVIDRDSYELLYLNESKELLTNGRHCIGKKCYSALYGKSAPCEFCTLKTHKPDSIPHEMYVESKNKFFSTHFKETMWNGIPAYVKYIRDITDTVITRKEKERLEQYFQTILKYLPGGIAVVLYEKDGHMTPEFLSEGFAAMTKMEMEEAWNIYKEDAMAGVHPLDREYVEAQMNEYVDGGQSSCEIVYRLLRGDGGYLWVKNTLSMIRDESGEQRVYAVYHDVTKEREEQEQIRRKYNELIMQNYHSKDPNVLVMGHCNITQNRILDISDRTGSNLLETFGTVRMDFFTGLGKLIADEKERHVFYNKYLNEPALRSYKNGEKIQKMECFVKFPKETRGRYVHIIMNLIATPDSGDVTGVLTVTDITEQTISERILHRLSVTGYDFVADVDIDRDRYQIIASGDTNDSIPPKEGSFSAWCDTMACSVIVPKDKERYKSNLEIDYIRETLQKDGAYTFAYTLIDNNGEIRTKNTTISMVDMKLGRICLSRSDITESVREQQGLLRLIAYTFELAGFINLENGNLTMYTRKTVLENLPPYFMEDYNKRIKMFVRKFGAAESQNEALAQFCTEDIIKNLEERPNGYDFLFLYDSKNEERYKQINVMWGDVNHKTICLVRADVTETLAKERQTKKALEEALKLAEEANRAKSDFLSAMSHDIRTPMNAIMGMTTLASSHIGQTEKVSDCLLKIASSSRHLLSLINDILDMSKIERSQITLNRMKIYLPELLEQLYNIIEPQAEEAGLSFQLDSEKVMHKYFYGDSLRINQILINILNNAVKYTPEGGNIDFKVEEIRPECEGKNVRYRFIIRDTGVGMSKEFLANIFEPFTRSRHTLRVEGTGLGLSITKSLVELMNGKIFVESELHRGTCFTVELEGECALEEHKNAEQSSAASIVKEGAITTKQMDGCLFLVAEDNAINAEILCEFLSMYGADAVVTMDGEKAVQAFCDSRPYTFDAILMDIQMPVMNGYDAARTIRAMDRPDAGSTPIVAMTANAFAEDVESAKKAGMTAHVAKPIDLKVFIETMKTVLNP